MDSPLEDLDLSLPAIVGFTALLTVGSYLLLAGLPGDSQWLAWGLLLVVVAAAAAGLVVLRDRGRPG